MYYIMAVVAFRSNGHHDLFGDEVNCPNKNFDGGTVIFLNVILNFF